MLFEGNKAALGFGCMRLPREKKAVDCAEFERMIDRYLDCGFRYFDTAHAYMRGQSEIALRECLVKRHERSRFLLADKLTDTFFETRADIEPFFEQQLAACGVSYFDVYLLHGLTAGIFGKFQRCGAFEVLEKLREQGKIRHLGISFHDRAEVLDRILTAYPQIELVQLQINYLDASDPGVQGLACRDVCLKHRKPILVMEPCKGGSLIRLPEDAAAVFRELGPNSPAYYAFHYVQELEGVEMVLSGMSNLQQLEENCALFRDGKRLGPAERQAIEEVCRIYRAKDPVPCTACSYCTEVCPMSVEIPFIFSCLNQKRIFRNWNQDYYYRYAVAEGKASACIRCGRCEARCPQHLPIRQFLEEAAKEFEKKK